MKTLELGAKKEIRCHAFQAASPGWEGPSGSGLGVREKSEMYKTR